MGTWLGEHQNTAKPSPCVSLAPILPPEALPTDKDGCDIYMFAKTTPDSSNQLLLSTFVHFRPPLPTARGNHVWIWAAVSTVRIQAEVLLLLTTLRLVFAAVFPFLSLEDEGPSTVVRLWKAGAIMLESGTTTVLVLWILERRFSIGANTRAWYRHGCIDAGGQVRELRGAASQLATTRLPLALAFFSVSGVVAGIILDIASLHNLLSKASLGSSSSIAGFQAAVTSMVRDPVLEEAFYRGVVFDLLLTTADRSITYGNIVEAAAASSTLFGGTHLLMHVLLDGVRVSWRVYQQTVLATVVGYVYCLLFFLGKGRLLPTIFLHAVNNIAASCFHSTLRQRHDTRDSSDREHRVGNSFNGKQVSCDHISGASDILHTKGTSAIAKGYSQWNPAGVLATTSTRPQCSLPVDDRPGKTPYSAHKVCRGPAAGGVIPRAGVGETESTMTCMGYASTVVVYLIAGRICHKYLRRVTTESSVCSGTSGVGGTVPASARPPYANPSTRSH